jgi:pyrroloquinoline-quinone synthase
MKFAGLFRTSIVLPARHTEEALAAFYAYESQVPRVATEKDRVCAARSADEKARVLRCIHGRRLSLAGGVRAGKQIAANPESAEKALAAAESAAKALWDALDGIEARRQTRVAA